MVSELSGELLVYDRSSQQVHCLNDSARCVFEACQNRVPPQRLLDRLALWGEAEELLQAGL